MDFKPGQVITFYYHNRARLCKVRKVHPDYTGGKLTCSINKNQLRTFFTHKMVEPELVGRLDRIWLWLRGVRF